MQGFIICDKTGTPITVELNEDLGGCLGYGPDNQWPVFQSMQEALDVLNALPATCEFEGFTEGTVRPVTMTFGDPVAWQEDRTEDDE